jgi:hypothetical protein
LVKTCTGKSWKNKKGLEIPGGEGRCSLSLGCRRYWHLVAEPSRSQVAHWDEVTRRVESPHTMVDGRCVDPGQEGGC